jgi:hypothetical protein
MILKYRITGTHKGKNINQVISAYSENQAKLRAGFKSKIGGGSKLQDYMDDSSIQVERI